LAARWASSALAALALAAPAHAATFGPSQTLGRDGRVVVAAAGDDGDAYVGWSGFVHASGAAARGKEGIWAVTRRRGRFGAAQRLTARDGIQRFDLALEADGRGHAALAWVDVPDAGPSAVRLAVAGRSGRFRRVALPRLRAPGIGSTRPVLAYGADGRIVVAWSAADAAGYPETLVAIRRRDGSWGAVQSLGAVSVADAARSGAEILLVASEGRTSAGRVVVYALGAGEARFARVADITPPARYLFGTPTAVVGNARGDALVVFPAGDRAEIPFPNAIYASLRRRGEAYGTARAVIGPVGAGLVDHPSAALAPSGDALVAAGGSLTRVAFARAGGPFAPAETGAAPSDPNYPLAAGLDRRGAGVLLLEGVAFVRPRAGPVSAVRHVLGKRAYAGAVAIGRRGGVAAWHARSGRGTRIVARTIR
jgi:hypothetical protein